MNSEHDRKLELLKTNILEITQKTLRAKGCPEDTIPKTYEDLIRSILVKLRNEYSK